MIKLTIGARERAGVSQPARRRVLALAILGVILLAIVVVIARVVISPRWSANSSAAARSPAAARVPSEPVEPVVQAVNAFSAFTLEQSARRGPDFNDEYPAEGLRLFAGVIDAFMVRDSLVRDVQAATSNQMRAEADRLERAFGVTSSVTPNRATFMAAAEIVTVVQRMHYPHLEQATTRLRDAARAIRPNRPLREQSAEIESFFQRASDAVQGMTAETS